MVTSGMLSRLLQWIAWISGTLLLLFLLLMLIGHLFGDANGPNGMAFASTADSVAFVLFPVCTMLGLGLAYKWELLGGMMVVVSIAVLCILRPDLLQASFVALAIPGLLYLLHWAVVQASGRRDQGASMGR